MTGPSGTAHHPFWTHLFWTCILGGGLGLWYGPPGYAAGGFVALGIVAHRLTRPWRIRRLVRRTAHRHARTLALRRRQECFVDAYGNLIDDGWVRERAYFLERTVLPLAQARGYDAAIEARWEEATGIVERVAAGVRLPDETETPEDGIAYERYCMARLAAAGWRAHPTPPSGDQGADIVAERDGVRLVVQCKRYGRPVGNGAVQEAAAAARHWSGDLAAVVSNAGFTPAARKLATTTGVLLLHHDDLTDLPARRARGRRAPA